MSEGSLVVFGSGGRHVSFTKSDLVLPAASILATFGEPGLHFAEKQWPAMCTFWMNRVLKDTRLHVLSVAEVIDKILDDVMHRFKKRKEEQQLHKKRKRLLENTDPDKGAGIPEKNVLIVNFVDLATYLKDKPASDAIIDAVLEACRMLTGHLRERKGKAPRNNSDGDDGGDGDGDEADCRDVVPHCIMVDEFGELPVVAQPEVADDGEPPAVRGPRLEGVEGDGEEEHAKTAPAVVFDDRVALVVKCVDTTSAATIIAKLHNRVLDGRALNCRFIGD